MESRIQIKVNGKYEDLNLYLDAANEVISQLEKFNNTFLYGIFQVCELLNIKYEDMEFRQRVDISTEGDKDFNINVNSGSVSCFKGQKCKCILCNREFIAIRSNIKVCASSHYCDIVCLYTGEIYRKEIMKWNKVEDEKGIKYIYGKNFSCKSSQVSANNMMTVYNGTNKICNMTYQDRVDITVRQKEAGTNFVTCASYEERSKVNSVIAKNRMDNGTHNWLWKNKTQEQRKISIENTVKSRKENGSYKKVMLSRWKDKEFKVSMSNNLKLRWKNDKDYRNNMVYIITENWNNQEYRGKMEKSAKENAINMVGSGNCTICGEANDKIGRAHV